MNFLFTNVDNTIFKSEDGIYINSMGSDVTEIINHRNGKEIEMFTLSSQPAFYLIKEMWSTREDKCIPVSVEGHYSKEDLERLETFNYEVIFTDFEGIEAFKVENNLA